MAKLDDQYYWKIAAAFVRGRARQGADIALSDRHRAAPLEDLSNDEFVEIFDCGSRAGLKLHKFKRTMGLARVRRVVGALKALAPVDLLDIGSGRGAFLWPLLDEFDVLRVTAIDENRQRASDLDAVRLGGIERLTSACANVTALSFAADSFDVVTMLEVLEHIPAAQQALSEVVRVASRSIVLSVPSKPDDNPGHIHLFNEASLRSMFANAGVHRITFDYVLGHLVAVANVRT